MTLPLRMLLVSKIHLLIAAFAILDIAVISGSDAQNDAALCGGRPHEMNVSTKDPTPAITLAADGRSGRFLLDYGATTSSLSADVFPGAAGSKKQVSISLPTFEKGTFRLARYALTAGSQQIGVIGVDFLSLLTVQLTGRMAYLGEKPCDADGLRAHGLVAVDQRGFFSSDPATIGQGRANVPVVFLRLGQVRAWAQIDTGYADTVYPRSVDINQALYDQLIEGGVTLGRVADIVVWTCDGREVRPVYSAKAPLVVENEGGARIVELQKFYLIVKKANGCGGIGSIATPAAQLGASFLELFGAVVFDPKSGTVWLGGRGEAPQRPASSSNDVR